MTRAQTGWLIIAILILVVIGVNYRGGPAATSTITPTTVTPVDYGNGVLYFPATNDALGRALSEFYKDSGKHCDYQGPFTKHVPGTSYEATVGSFFHCRDIAVEAQEITVP